jgi:hypothetical protein
MHSPDACHRRLDSVDQQGNDLCPVQLVSGVQWSCKYRSVARRAYNVTVVFAEPVCFCYDVECYLAAMD